MSETPTSGEGAAESRLPNLQKLYHVPVFALRKLLHRRDSGRTFGELHQGELVAEADKLLDITEADVDGLYENYRYGRSLAFYVYLLPTGLAQPALEDLQAALDEQTGQPQTGAGAEIAAAEDYENEHSLEQIILLDEERLNGIHEIRFRYHVVHRFLNAEEQPDQVLQTRYGFMWLDLDAGYLAILSRDERINHLLTRALSHCLQALPLPVRFSKELVDKHFSIEKVKRVSHYDPGTGVRQSLSGQDLWKAYEQEILAREQRYSRPSSLYEEEIAEGVITGLGITASKGKIYLTRTLPTSQVRAWGLQRLPDLIADVRDLRAQEPEKFSRSLESINRMRLPARGKSILIRLTQALLAVEREELTSMELTLSALEIYEGLAGKYFSPYLRTDCGQCDEMAMLCPYCESHAIELDEGQVTCRGCKAVLSDGDMVALRCMNGHITNAPLAEAFSIAPNHWLQKRIVRVFAEIGQHWSERADYFHIEANTLHRMRRGQVESAPQPPVVQNYINNYWEPVAGQVHAGSGDIVVGAPSSGNGSGGGPRMTYKDFDLRIRGSVATGYTVEAATSDGGSVAPQPLILPSGNGLNRRLADILAQPEASEEVQAAGEALFNSLFPTRVLKLWARAAGSLEERQGLRLRLHINPPLLMSIPWELLYEDEHLGLRLRFPTVRYLNMVEPPKPLLIQPPLRMLVAVSQPDDQPALDVEAELSYIDRALEPLSGVIEKVILEHTTREELLAQLRQGYHLLHYVGHGSFSGESGYLALEGQDGRADPVSALLLGQMVADSDLRLVLLNACESSLTGLNNFWGGVAHQLVRGGIPAVVAMQRPIADESAIAFSRGIYGALAHGWPVDTAVQEGRRSIVTALGNDWQQYVDWAIPTLYMRAPDGVILRLDQ